MRLQHPKEDSHMTRIIFTMAAAVAVLTAFAIATPADAQNCRTVTTTVQTDDGRVFGRRERRCDIARRPNCRILTACSRAASAVAARRGTSSFAILRYQRQLTHEPAGVDGVHAFDADRHLLGHGVCTASKRCRAT
jgi:hypothetical protein